MSYETNGKKYRYLKEVRNAMHSAGVSAVELADVWGVSPTTVRHKIYGLIGTTDAEIQEAINYCIKKKNPELYIKKTKPKEEQKRTASTSEMSPQQRSISTAKGNSNEACI